MKVKEYFEDMQNKLTAHLESLGIKITAENIDNYTDEDFAKIRHIGFGASDSSKILNVNPFPNGSPEELLHEKIHEIVDTSIGEKATVRMGKDLEAFIIKRFEEITGYGVLKPVHMYGREQNGLNTNFDGVLLIENVFYPLEVKTISQWGRKHYNLKNALQLSPNTPEDILDQFKNMPMIPYVESELEVEEEILNNASENGIPPYYYTQLQQQIDFLNSPHGYLLVLDVYGWAIYVFKIDRNKRTIKELNQRASILYYKLQLAKGNIVLEDDNDEDI
jgi:hypothetical protein